MSTVSILDATTHASAPHRGPLYDQVFEIEPATAGRGLLLAQIISLVCLPPLLAIVTLVVLSSHMIADSRQAARVAGTASFFTSIAPALYITYLLKSKKVAGGVDLALKEERLRPYLVAVASSLLGLPVLWRLNAPPVIGVLTLCYAVNSLVMAIITQRWKISAHAAGAAMPLTALLASFGGAALPFMVIVPVVCWARVRARMHTVAQVCAGALLGFTLTWVQFALLTSRF